MYQLVNTKTGEVLGEYLSLGTALIHLNSHLWLYGKHFAIREAFNTEEKHNV
jgi:hypothetical protein